MYALESLVVDIVGVQIVHRAYQTSPVYGDFPVFAIVCLSESRQEYRIDSGPSRVWMLGRLVIDGPVKKGSPVHETCTDKQPGASLFRTIVYARRNRDIDCPLRDRCKGSLIVLLRHIVFVEVIPSGTGKSPYASVDDREFPVLPVVYLRYARQKQ